MKRIKQTGHTFLSFLKHCQNSLLSTSLKPHSTYHLLISLFLKDNKLVDVEVNGYTYLYLNAVL